MEANISLQHELEQFTGTGQWYAHPVGRAIYGKESTAGTFTDGVRYLAEQAKCFWLIDAIFSHQYAKTVRQEWFQVWKLTVNDSKGLLEMRLDSPLEPVCVQEIPFTDFPLPQIELWLVHGTLILPSEY